MFGSPFHPHGLNLDSSELAVCVISGCVIEDGLFEIRT